MMLEDIAQHAYQRLRESGGVTVNLQGVEPTSGYAYGGYVELERVVPTSAVTPDTILQYMRDTETALSMPGHYLGIWDDTQSGNTFLDVSIVSPAGEDALKDAKDRGQIAVWDIGGDVEIPTGATLDRNITSAVDHQAVLDANAGQDLQGLPGAVNVPGSGPLQFRAHGDIQRLANEYNQANGLGAHPTDYARVNPQTGAQIAQEYEAMAHNPHDPQVAGAYDALARETRAQYDHAVNNGYRFEFYPEHNPYPNSPREAVLDLHHNKHMYVYPTVEGYGNESQDATDDHPLLQDSGVRWNGKPVTHNDLFRAVHDFYGHAKEGLGFRADGEDNAYRQHAAMFTDQARRALTSETRGQNSWVNFGPHGEHNQTATSDTVYAPQKAGLMPDWTMHPDLHRQSAFKLDSGWDSLSYSREGSTRLNLTFEGAGEWQVVPNSGGEVKPAPHGTMCSFHPQEPAVAIGGFAAMCSRCLSRYEHAQIRTAPDMRTVPPHQLAKTAWELPEDFGMLGPQSLEEHALMSQPHVDPLTTCPQCGAVTKFPLGGCPHCGYHPDQHIARSHYVVNEYGWNMIPEHVHAEGDLNGRPFLVSHGDGVVHLGPEGASHNQMYAAMGYDPFTSEIQHGEGWTDRDDTNVSFRNQNFNLWHGQVANALEKHLRKPMQFGHPYNMPDPYEADTWDAHSASNVQASDGVNEFGQGDREKADEWDGADFRIGEDWFDGADGDPLPKHDLDSQDNGHSTERDHTAIEPDTDESGEWDRWEDEGGTTSSTTANSPSPTILSGALYLHDGLPYPQPLTELVHALGLDTWELAHAPTTVKADTHQLVGQGLTDKRPSGKALLSSEGIREPIEIPAEGWEVFSTIPDDHTPKHAFPNVLPAGPNAQACPRCGGQMEEHGELAGTCPRCGYAIGGEGGDIYDGWLTPGGWASEAFPAENRWDPIGQGWGPRRFGETIKVWQCPVCQGDGEIHGVICPACKGKAFVEDGRHMSGSPFDGTSESVPPGITVKPEAEINPYRPMQDPVIHDWRNRLEPDPLAGHGTNDFPYFWDLNKNEVHLGPQDWFHDAFRQDLKEYGIDPYQEGGGMTTPGGWALGRTNSYRFKHAPVFRALEAHGVPTDDGSWGDVFSRVSKFRMQIVNPIPNPYGMRQLRPFIANPEDATVYVGGEGANHASVYDQMPNGWGANHSRGLLDTKNMTYQAMGSGYMHPDAHAALTESGYHDHKDGSWGDVFSKVWEFVGAGPINLKPLPRQPRNDFYYHQAPTTERQRIMEHGLVPARPMHSERWDDFQNLTERSVRSQPEGIYVTDHERGFPMKGQYDTWRIPGHMVNEFEKDRRAPNAFIIRHQVNPELHERYEDTALAENDVVRDAFKNEHLPLETDAETEPWQMHFEWAENAKRRGVPPNMDDYQRQLGVGFPTHVMGSSPHNLVWEPGWPGKGIYHNGELTTWGTNSNASHMGWPHHIHMWNQRYPGKPWPGLNDPNTLFLNIEPEGQVREAHPFKGEWPEEMYSTEPRFKRYGEESWANEFM